MTLTDLAQADVLRDQFVNLLASYQASQNSTVDHLVLTVPDATGQPKNVSIAMPTITNMLFTQLNDVITQLNALGITVA